MYGEVSFSTPGEPKHALMYRKHEGLPPAPPQSSWGMAKCVCRVDILNAPWNPADAFTVQGRYGSPYADKDANRDALRQSPFYQGCTVAGSEGFGRVAEVLNCGGDDSENSSEHDVLNVGDWVMIGQPGLGTIRSTFWIPADAALRIDRGQELWEKAGPQACTLLQLGGTALRMLRDFVTLQPGDVVLQNAGNSAVGFMVSQLASLHMNAVVVSVVRRGSKTSEQWHELVRHLTENGKCALVVAEDELQDEEGMTAFQSQLKNIGNGKLPRLALDSVGGASASILLSSLANGGTMVTYGGISRQPIAILAGQLIYKDLRVVGHWHSRWMVQHSYDERLAMANELVQSLLDEGLTCPPVQVFPLSQLEHAMEWESTQQAYQAVRRKLVWDCLN